MRSRKNQAVAVGLVLVLAATVTVLISWSGG